MSSYTDALEGKISALEDEKQELEDAIGQVGAKLAVLRELIADEMGTPRPQSQLPQHPNPPAMPGKKRGRPRGSKNKTKREKIHNPKKAKKAEVEGAEPLVTYEEAMSVGGEDAKTDPELAERLKNRFHAFPRSQQGYGTAKVGSEKEAPSNQSDSTISMPDDLAPGEE